jgi:subtilisin family serine protease
MTGISSRGARLAAWAACALLCAGVAADAEVLRPRTPAAKPARTRLARGDDAQRVVVKFAEGSARRAPAAAELAVRATGAAPRALRRLFARPDRDLDRLRERAERRSARALADLALYYEITLPPGQDAAAVCDALNARADVELALPAREPAPAPLDLPPVTPSFVAEQGYRSAPPAGVDAKVALRIPGANGAGIAIADVEYSWVLDHEDIELPASVNVETATPSDPFPNDQGNHGTAVLGILRGRDNPYGVLGLVPAASLFVAPANTVQHGYDPARAIDRALDVLVPGDVLLLEQQTWVCDGLLGPLEGYPPWFDAIAHATALGVVVIEPAGNGGVDLDGAACDGWFDRATRDSGAIVVGAGNPNTRARLGLSAYGSRVDVQGWGSGVTSTGYRDLFDPGDVRQRYTGLFGGTSGASAIVAGVAASVQGAVLADGAAPLEPDEMRDLLVATGTPQTGAGHIGPLPSITAALAGLGIAAPPPPPSCGLGGLELAAALLLLARLRRRD